MSSALAEDSSLLPASDISIPAIAAPGPPRAPAASIIAQAAFAPPDASWRETNPARSTATIVRRGMPKYGSRRAGVPASWRDEAFEDVLTVRCRLVPVSGSAPSVLHRAPIGLSLGDRDRAPCQPGVERGPHIVRRRCDVLGARLALVVDGADIAKHALRVDDRVLRRVARAVEPPSVPAESRTTAGGTPAPNRSGWRRAARPSPAPTSASPSALIDSAGRTQGIRLSSVPRAGRAARRSWHVCACSGPSANRPRAIGRRGGGECIRIAGRPARAAERARPARAGSPAGLRPVTAADKRPGSLGR